MFLMQCLYVEAYQRTTTMCRRHRYVFLHYPFCLHGAATFLRYVISPGWSLNQGSTIIRTERVQQSRQGVSDKVILATIQLRGLTYGIHVLYRPRYACFDSMKEQFFHLRLLRHRVTNIENTMSYKYHIKTNFRPSKT